MPTWRSPVTSPQLLHSDSLPRPDVPLLERVLTVPRRVPTARPAHNSLNRKGNPMYIGGGAVVLILIIIVVVLVMRR
jgi:hypothetical protein